MTTSNQQLRESQLKALEICTDANLREYCLRLNFYIFDLQNPTYNGDCNNSARMILGDAVAFLIEMTENFEMTEINSRFIRSLYFRKRKQLTVTKKSDSRKFKIIIKAESIDMSLWENAKLNLWKNEPS